MCAAYTLPADLAPEEAATVEAFRARAVREATERAALAVRVRREVKRLVKRGYSLEASFALIADDGLAPVSAGTARNIWYRRAGWG